MNLRRASTSSPISVVKIVSHSAISSSFTESKRAPFGIHRRFPQLRRGHLAQSFVALDREVLAPFVDHVIAKLADVRLLHDLDFLLRFAGLQRPSSPPCRSVGFRFAVCAIAIGLAGAALVKRLDDKRRLHVGLDLLELRDQLPALRAGSQLPVDHVLGAVLVDEAHFPKVVFFVEFRLDAFEAFVLLQLLEFFFQPLDLLRRSFLLAFEIRALRQIEFRNQFGDSLVAHALVELLEEAEIFVEHGHEPRQIFAFELGRAFAVTD